MYSIIYRQITRFLKDTLVMVGALPCFLLLCYHNHFVLSFVVSTRSTCYLVPRRTPHVWWTVKKDFFSEKSLCSEQTQCSGKQILTLSTEIMISIINASPQEELKTSILLKQTIIIVVLININTTYISLDSSFKRSLSDAPPSLKIPTLNP